jgi:hypothetical protein
MIGSTEKKLDQLIILKVFKKFGSRRCWAPRGLPELEPAMALAWLAPLGGPVLPLRIETCGHCRLRALSAATLGDDEPCSLVGDYAQIVPKWSEKQKIAIWN